MCKEDRFHEDERINEILKDLFYNRMDAEVSLKEWVSKLPQPNFIPIWIDENQNKDE